MTAADTKQCSILVVDPSDTPSPHRVLLESLGFRIDETRDWPEDEGILDYEVIIVRVRRIGGAPMIAARLRAKPRFGRRVLIALVPASVSLQERMSVRTSGFDEVLTDCCDGRLLGARILRRLRTRPEYHCVLPHGDKRRHAA